MIWDSLDKMCEIYRLYFENITYFIVIAVVILMLLTKFRNRQTLGYLAVCGIVWILFLNPITVHLICSLTEVKRYVRIFWAFPLILGVGYVGVRLIDRDKLWKKALVFLAIAVVLFGTGGTILNEQNYAQASNLYKLPSDVIPVADAILENCKEEWECPCVLTTVYLGTYLRQYDGNIRLLYGRATVKGSNKDLYKIVRKYMDKDIPYDELYGLGEQALQRGANMIVLLKYQVQNQALESLGFTRIDCLDDYYIFRYDG